MSKSDRSFDPKAPRLSQAEINNLAKTIPVWKLLENDGVAKLQRQFSFGDFNSGLAFINQIAQLADSANHHPDLQLSWGKVIVQWWTHSTKGLTLNDFQLAGETDVKYLEQNRNSGDK